MDPEFPTEKAGSFVDLSSLTEMTSFESIPVKVSINEYIDISKEYSTPKSKQFINGIIDKLATEYKEAGKIVKSGRGLVE